MSARSSQQRRVKVDGRDTVGIYKARSGRFEIAYRAHGKLCWFSSPLGWTLAEAKAKRDELRHSKNEGTLAIPSKLSVGEAVTAWLEDGRPTWAPRTYESRESTMRLHVVPAIGHVRVRDLSKHEIAKVVTEMQKDGKEASTIKLAIGMLSALCSHLIENDQLATSPVAAFSQSKSRKRQLQTKQTKVKVIEEVVALLGAVRRPEHARIIKTAILSGLRLSEVLGLRVRDVGEGVLLVRGQLERKARVWTPRTKTPQSKRDVLVPEALTTELLESRPDANPDELLFLAKDGLGWWAQVIERGFDRAVEDAGLDETLTFHATRHTAASRWIHEGRSVGFVAGQLGDSIKTVLETYAHQIDKVREGEAAREAADAVYAELSRPALKLVAGGATT